MFKPNKTNFVRVPMNKPPAAPVMKPQAMPLPFVRVFADPAGATPDNPNGINIQTNFNTTVPGWELMVIQMLLEGGQHWIDAMRKKSLPKTSQAGLVMPDGRPAVIPEEATPNVQG